MNGHRSADPWGEFLQSQEPPIEGCPLGVPGDECGAKGVVIELTERGKRIAAGLEELPGEDEAAEPAAQCLGAICTRDLCPLANPANPPLLIAKGTV